jgi:hypothetical protein
MSGPADATPAPFVAVVSGPPRSGTSLMMQMLEAGGVAPLADGARAPDAGNPRGYYELEAVKRLPDDAGWVARAPGRAVKVIHALVARLPEAPAGCRWRVIWMERDLDEVVRSQNALLETLGRTPDDGLPDARVARILGDQLARAARALDARPDVARLAVAHAGLLADPGATAARVAGFLGVRLDVAAMAKVVDPALHRVRGDAAG